MPSTINLDVKTIFRNTAIEAYVSTQCHIVAFSLSIALKFQKDVTCLSCLNYQIYLTFNHVALGISFNLCQKRRSNEEIEHSHAIEGLQVYQ